MRVLLAAVVFVALVWVFEPAPDRTIGEQWVEARAELREITTDILDLEAR